MFDVYFPLSSFGLELNLSAVCAGSKQWDTVYRKAQSCLYFLRQLRSFNICRAMLRKFGDSMVASVNRYAVVQAGHKKACCRRGTGVFVV